MVAIYAWPPVSSFGCWIELLQSRRMKGRAACRLALGLGLVSILALFLAFMALQDIYHGEADLTLEWSALRLSFLVIIAFHATALFALWKVLAAARE